MDAKQELKVSNTKFTISLATLSDAFFNAKNEHTDELWLDYSPSDEELLEALRKDANEFLTTLLPFADKIEEDWCEYLAQDFLHRL